MTLPSTPIAWANRLSAVLTATLGGDRFPVDVEQLAIDYTTQVYEDPVTAVIGEPLGEFESALFPSSIGQAALFDRLRHRAGIRWTHPGLDATDMHVRASEWASMWPERRGVCAPEPCRCSHFARRRIIGVWTRQLGNRGIVGCHRLDRIADADCQSP